MNVVGPKHFLRSQQYGNEGRSDRISSELASCGDAVASSGGLSDGEEKNCQEEGYKEKRR